MWHSSLTKENSDDLERVQKAALKVILRNDYQSYKDALKLTNLESLDDRREALSIRFARNCLKNENFSKLFPHNSQKHGMKVRNPLKYQIMKANTERYKTSSIPYMQRSLNVDHQKREREICDLNKELSKSKRMKLTNSSPTMQVNYVCN